VVGIDIEEVDGVGVNQFVNKAPVAGNIEASLLLALSRKRVIVQARLPHPRHTAGHRRA